MHTYLLMGAKAGVGATTCAVNGALALARAAQRPAMVIDADPDAAGDAAHLLGVERVRSLAEVAAAVPRLVGESLVGYCAAARRGVGLLTLETSGDLSELQRSVAQVWPRLAAHYHAVIIDAGMRIVPATAMLWSVVTHWGLVVTPELNVIRAAERLLQQWERALVPKSNVVLVANQWSDAAVISQEAASQRLGREIVATLPHDADAGHAIAEGHPLLLRTPKSDLATTISEAMASWEVIAPVPAAAVHPDRVMPELEMLVDSAAPSLGGRETDELKANLLDGLLQRVDITKLQTERGDDDAVRAIVEQALVTLVNETPEQQLECVDRAVLVRDLLHEALGLGPLEEILQDETVTEVMVNGTERIFCERAGRLTLSPQHFRDESQLRRVVERIVTPTGRHVDERSPIVDTRLPDGARVNVVLPPIALGGPTITIRRFGRTPWTLERLVTQGSITVAAAARLHQLVTARKNILVIGGTGSGKTTLLNVLSGAIPEHERIITIEDAAELQLQQPHVVRLEARPQNLEGEGEITIRDLVRTALRMRPDRIIVGECRGPEALDMLQAMQTGHDGSLTTLHANNPQEAIHRLATLVCFAGLDLPLGMIHEQIAGALDVIVQVARTATGKRVIQTVAEVVGCGEGRVVLRDIEI